MTERLTRALASYYSPAGTMAYSFGESGFSLGVNERISVMINMTNGGTCNTTVTVWGYEI
jgi:hypothetical protein